MARSRYKEAAKVAIILANNEQIKGKHFFQVQKIFIFFSILINNIKISVFRYTILSAFYFIF